MNNDIKQDDKLISTLVRIRPDVKLQFDHLKVEQGARSGARLMHEAMNMLFKAYGKPEIPFSG